MQQSKIICIVLALFWVTQANAQGAYEARVRKYIEQYKDWAIAEQRRSGVPAAITLAQGIHETSAGASELATNANNHFGIKCRKEWIGSTYAYTDDAPDECFRKYPSAFQSYKDHSDYLTGSRRYSGLFKLSAHDYKGWAHGLRRCGYATNPKYAHLIIKIVEEYDLQQYTKAALKENYHPAAEPEVANSGHLYASTTTMVAANDSYNPELQNLSQAEKNTGSKSTGKKGNLSVSYGEVAQQEKKQKADEQVTTPAPVTAEYGKLVKVNGLKAFYAKKGSVLLEDAFKYNMRYARLLEINELPDLPLEADMYIFLEKKNAKGIHQTHIVKQGETLVQVAQMEAMQLRYLKYYNHIGSNEEPVPGAVLQLQAYTENKPQTYVRNVAPKDESLAFAGSTPKAVPQGATRKRAGYVSKSEINDGQQLGERVADVAGEEVAAIKPTHEKQEDITTTEPHTVPAQTIEAEPAAEVPATQTTRQVIEPTDEVVNTEEPKETLVVEKAMQEKEPEVKAEVPKPVVQEEKIDKEAIVAVIEPTVAKSKKEEIDYEVVQPEPVIVSKESKNNTEENKEDVLALPKAEVINPLSSGKKEIKAMPNERVSIKTPQQVAVPQMPEEPKDEFERLKAKLDRVVYAVPDIEEPKAEEKKAESKKEVSKPIIASAPAAKTYTVKKGDTAFSIAKKHNITMRQLMDWNDLNFDKIKEGQKLRVK